MAPSVRLAGAEDAGDVARLLVGFRDHLGYATPTAERFRARVGELLGSGDCDFLLGAVADGEPPAGVCQLRYRLGVWLDGTDVLLEDLYVDAAARGGGLGRALLEAALARARDRNAVRIELDVNEANPGALALYRSVGFGTKSTMYEGARDLYLRLHLG